MVPLDNYLELSISKVGRWVGSGEMWGDCVYWWGSRWGKMEKMHQEITPEKWTGSSYAGSWMAS